MIEDRNVVLNRQVSVLPKLYNCGSFIDCMGDKRFYQTEPFQGASKLVSKMFKGAAIKFFQHTHLPITMVFMQLLSRYRLI